MNLELVSLGVLLEDGYFKLILVNFLCDSLVLAIFSYRSVIQGLADVVLENYLDGQDFCAVWTKLSSLNRNFANTAILLSSFSLVIRDDVLELLNVFLNGLSERIVGIDFFSESKSRSFLFFILVHVIVIIIIVDLTSKVSRLLTKESIS